MKLFPALPADLSAATDDELAQLHAQHIEAAQKIRSNDAEFLGELAAADILAELKAGVEQANQLKAEQTARVEAQAAFMAEVEALTSEVEPEAAADETTDEADTAETAEKADDVEAEADAAETAAESTETTVEVEHADEVVVAAAPRFARPPAVAKQHKPQPRTGDGTALVAAGGLQGIEAGSRLDMATLERAVVAAMHRYPQRPGAPDAIVAAAHYEFPEDRILRPGYDDDNARKIAEVVSPEALVASGGLCAPVTPRYELENIAVTDRPVKNSLAGYQAVRGGLRFAAAPVIADITTGVGKITAAQDAAGGSSGTKTCQTIICPSFSEVDVAAIYHCASAGNLGARAYPEQLAQFMELLMAAHARTAETALLDAISAGSTAVTAAQIGGAVSSLFPAMINAAAQMRSYYRMGSDATLRVLVPAWAKDLLKADIVRQPFDKYQISDAELVAIIRSFNIEPSFYLDGETGGGQVLNKQNAGALNGWPTTVKWFIFPEGTWLFLDGGSLELGLVRDSTLNATNTFQMFGETWENVAKVGVVSYEVTSTVQDTGALTATASVTNPAY